MEIATRHNRRRGVAVYRQAVFISLDFRNNSQKWSALREKYQRGKKLTSPTVKPRQIDSVLFLNSDARRCVLHARR